MTQEQLIYYCIGITATVAAAIIAPICIAWIVWHHKHHQEDK